MGSITGIFSSIPLDWFILGGITLLIALDALRAGLGRANALAIALPLALFLHSFLGKAVFLGSLSFVSGTTMIQAAIFGVFVVISYFIVRRMGLDFIDSGMGEPIQAALAGVAVAVIFCVIWLQTPALESLWHFGPNVQAAFAEGFRLWWLLGAYAALAFARG